MSKKNLSKERDEKLVPLARSILLAIAAREDLVMGGPDSTTFEEGSKYYQAKYTEIVIPMLIEADIKILDIDYLFQLMAQPFDSLRELSLNSFNVNRNLCDALSYGLKDIDDLRISELDSKLKELAKKNK